MGFRTRTIVLAAIGTLGIISVPAIAQLIGAEQLLQRLEKTVKDEQLASPSNASALLTDVRRFRTELPSMDASRSAETWLSLYDRTAALGPVPFDGDFSVFDIEVSNVVGVQSLLGSLPAPAAWPALREGANRRAAGAPDQPRVLALRLVTELLTADPRAARVTLSQIERATAKLPPNEREAMRAQATYARAQVARLYGSPEEIAETFTASLEARPGREYGAVAVPDLVGLVGEARATAILREALAKPVRLRVPEGDRTRVLARRLALERVETLAVGQWGLVDSIEAADLYEALQRRFGGASGPEDRVGGKSDADAYYFLHLVIAGRHADAENVLRAATRDGELQLSRRAVAALQRAGQNEALYGFLHSLLGRRPETRAWELYTKQAAYTGHSAQALALVDELLKRQDLPAHVLAELRFHRVNALLAADRVEPALTELRQLLKAAPKREERDLQARMDGALRLAGLGRVLERRDLSQQGLAFAKAVLLLPAGQERNWERDRNVTQLFAEQRKLGLAADAQALAVAEIERTAGTPSQQEQYGFGAPPERAALVELVGLYGEAKRHKDVLVLLDDSAKWGARDLSEVLTETDSLGAPVGLYAARALASTGNQASAVAIARALVEARPGYDPAYELLIEIDRQANDYLNTVYARDRFEERPLIWKAILMHRAGRHLEAESLIREAIVIDPSDGEEGAPDRMRAYAVLADVLEAKGPAAQAAVFRGAVRAIRISERADELHRLGLHERAFAGYRAALEQFADAYCIQSRLAVRLNEQGRHKEAYEHYRRAYELMPASFGRVESHCFGCESVFQGPDQQKIAEQVFNGLLAKEPDKPQLHYLLGYLQKERGLYGDALKRFRQSVALDPLYLNAWKHLHEIGTHVYMEPRERDAARLKLLELDPGQKHVHYELRSVADLGALFRALEAANASYKGSDASTRLYPLRRSAAAYDANRARLPEAMRTQLDQFQAMEKFSGPSRGLPTARQALARHDLMTSAARLMGVRDLMER